MNEKEPQFFRKRNGPITHIREYDGKGPYRHGGLFSAKEVEADVNRCVAECELLAQYSTDPACWKKQLPQEKAVQARIKEILNK